MNERGNGDVMRRVSWFLLPALAVVIALAIAPLASKAWREANLGKAGTPVVFILSREHGEELTPAQKQTFVSYLESETGLVTELRVAATALDGVEAFPDGADVGLLNLFEYLLTRKEYDVQAHLQVTRRNGSSTYFGQVLVPTHSAAKSIGDLAGKRVAYVDRFSTSGFVFPAKQFADAGVRVEAEFAGSHPEGLARLRDGRVDAAATYEGAASGDPTVRSVVRSGPIPNEPVFFRRDLAPEKRERLIAALKKLATTVDGKAVLQQMADITGFQPVDDSVYKSVLAAIRAAVERIHDVVPEGDQVESRRRGFDLIP